jgi:hypothetical protein
MEKPLQFTRSSRKHRVGAANGRHVIATGVLDVGRRFVDGDVMMSRVGSDLQGRELEVVAVVKPDCILVIHVMPTYYRKGRR